MGTVFAISVYARNVTNAAAAASAAFQRVDALEEIMSDYQADSELMRLCDQPYGKPVVVSRDLFTILEISQKVAERSDGAFDVTIGPYTHLWRYARKHKTLPTESEMASARAAVGWQKLKLDAKTRTVTLSVPNMRLDLGGIGKGFAADEALKVLKSRGMNRALVAASGDIAVGDRPPEYQGWKIGIATFGTRTNELACELILQNAGISTSGDSEQFVVINGVRYSHIINPKTGLGLTNRIQDTILGPNATTTDGLDTTVNILGVKRGMELVDSTPDTAALITVEDDGKVHTYTSSRFPPLISAPPRK